MLLTIDLESRSRVDLVACGPDVYAEDPTTEILCFAFKADDRDPMIYIPPYIYEHPEGPNLDFDFIEKHLPQISHEQVFELFNRADEIEAHNAYFERVMWHHICHLRWGWPDLPIEKIRCSAAKAAYATLPRDLGRACKAIGLPERKDEVGSAIMKRWCKPRKPTKANPKEWYDDPQEFIQLCKYCMQDVTAEHALSQALPELSPDEFKVWQLDQTINARGLRVDTHTAKKWIALLEDTERTLLEEFRELLVCTDVAGLDRPTQTEKFREWLDEQGLEIPNCQKATVEDALKLDLPDHVRRALEIRLQLSKSSVKKYQTLLVGASSDGRMRSLLMYHGAHTGRWTGKRFQPQNLYRGTFKDVDLCIETLHHDPEMIGWLWTSPHEAAATCIRSTLTASDNHRLLCADFSSIEGRVLAWMAQEQTVLNDYRNNLDAYKVGATRLFGVRYEDVTGDQRQAAKPRELGLGYNGGIGAYDTFCTAYGVDPQMLVEIVLPTMTGDEEFMANKLAKIYAKKHPDCERTHEQLMAMDVDKQRWRKDHPCTVHFWKSIEAMVLDAIRDPGSVQSFGKFKARVKGPFLLILTPANSIMRYFSPQIKMRRPSWADDEEPDEEVDMKETFSYMGIHSQTGRWLRMYSYGGKITENIDQHLSYVLMSRAMLRTEAAGYPTVLTVHDEILADVPNGHGSLEEFCTIMGEVPSWAPDLPMGVDGWEGFRYRKD